MTKLDCLTRSAAELAAADDATVARSIQTYLARNLDRRIVSPACIAIDDTTATKIGQRSNSVSRLFPRGARCGIYLEILDILYRYSRQAYLSMHICLSIPIHLFFPLNARNANQSYIHFPHSLPHHHSPSGTHRPRSHFPLRPDGRGTTASASGEKSLELHPTLTVKSPTTGMTQFCAPTSQ